VSSSVAAPVTEGVSATGVAVTVKVRGPVVATPPLAVPPESVTETVTVAVPIALGASV
jgi:hypothetical protein